MRLSKPVTDYLTDSARHTGKDPAEIVAALFHLRDSDRSELRDYFEGASETFIEVLKAFDHAVRVRNPGVQYTYRNAYLGYRRETVSAPRLGERSQVFLSLKRAKSKFVVALPVDPAEYADFTGARNVQGKGRHGIGDLQIEIMSLHHLDEFVERFEPWLAQDIGRRSTA